MSIPLPTLRSVGSFCLGLGLVVAARWLGRPEIAGLGAALMALPVLAFVAAFWWRHLPDAAGPAPVRTLEGAGESAPRVGQALTVSLSFPDDRVQGHERTARGRIAGSAPLRYPFVPDTRGVHRLGPWTSRRHDPLHLVTVTAVVDRGTDVVVVPVPAGDEELGRGLEGVRAARGAGGDQLDATTRSYRPGDPLRSVHWPVSARQGRLMVRPQVHEVSGAPVVLLDRTPAHYPGEPTTVSTAAGPNLDSTSTFDSALSSVSTLLTRLDRLECFPAAPTDPDRERLLALLTPATGPGAGTGAPPPGEASMTVIVTGVPGPEAAQWPQRRRGPVTVALHPLDPQERPPAEVLSAWERAGWEWIVLG